MRCSAAGHALRLLLTSRAWTHSPGRVYPLRPGPAALCPRRSVAMAAASHAAPQPELREKAERIAAQLTALYPPPLAPPLNHRNHFELLCAVVLSAQTTDKKVNEVTPALFAAAPTPEAMAALPVETIQSHIRHLGLSQAKAKYLSGLSAQLVARHGSEVPRTFAELEALPGVGHKTASVVMAQAFGVPAFPVDTHIWRLAMRWGLSPYNSNVTQVERSLKALFPEATWADLHLQIIFFGRAHCAAVRHDAATCPICSWAGVEAPPALDGASSTPRKKGGVKAEAEAAVALQLATPEAATPAKRARKAQPAPRGAARALPVQP